MIRIIAYILLALFLVLYGLMSVTNFRVAAMETVTGLAALAAGILFFVLAVKGST